MAGNSPLPRSLLKICNKMKINYLHRIFISIVLTLLPLVMASAQDEIGSILSCIEQNNRELSALRSSIEADKYGY